MKPTLDAKAYHREASRRWYIASKGKAKVIACPDCAQQVEKYRGGRCRTCYFARQLEQRRVARSTKKCEECQMEFAPRIMGQHYCSSRCADKKRWRSQRILREIPCKHCGVSFQQKKYTQTFCSDRCSTLARQARRRKGGRVGEQRLTAECRQCGEQFTQPRRFYIKRASSRAPQFCSAQCHYAHKRTLRGRPAAIGGKCWEVAAHEARQIGGNQCCICSSRVAGRGKKQVPVDHIIPRRLMQQWGFDPHQQGNLACLCIACHGKKTSAEWLLFRGDLVGFVSALAGMSYPRERVVVAFALAELSGALVERIYGGAD